MTEEVYSAIMSTSGEMASGLRKFKPKILAMLDGVG